MTSNDKLQAAGQVFIVNAMKTVRALHPEERRQFLIFFLHEVGDKLWAEPLREMLVDMDRVEGQIEMWAQGQMRLNLEAE